MDAEDKAKEIEIMIKELEKLMRYLYVPINRLRNLREQISGSVDLLIELRKGVNRASKKDHELTLDVVTQMATTDSKMLDRFFEAVIVDLEKTKREVKDKWAAIKEMKADELKADQLVRSDNP